MIKKRIRLLLQATLLLCWVISSPVLCSPVMAQDAIVNREVTESAVSQSSLRAIFSMHMRLWSDGKPIKVFVLPSENDVHVSFSKKVLHTFPYQLKRSWDILVYSGSGQAPTQVGSPEEMLRKVSSTPGAIGYVPEDYLNEGGKHENVRVLEIR